MPKALAVDWNEVKTLALAIGVREAARQMGLPVDAVKKRSAREGWIAQKRAAQEQLQSTQAAAQAALRARQGLAPHVPTAAEVLAKVGGKTRAALANGILKASEHVESLDGDAILERAQNVGSLVKSAALVHGWQDQDARASGPMLVNVDLRGMTLSPSPEYESGSPAPAVPCEAEVIRE